MPNVRIKAILKGLTARTRRLIENPTGLMKQLGALMVAQSGKAFDESRLGEYEWPKRYPNMGDGEHFVNIAGIVSDFAQGKEPPLRRFQSRPPLIDTGWLRRTMKDQSKSMHLISRFEVEVGTTDPRGAKHQWGGQDEQFVTDVVRENLAKFLMGGPSWTRTKSKKFRVQVDLSEWGGGTRDFYRTKKTRYQPAIRAVKTDAKTGYMGALTRRERFGPTLGFLFRNRVLVTKLRQRPFVGIPDDLRVKLLNTVAAWFNVYGGQNTITGADL